MRVGFENSIKDLGIGDKLFEPKSSKEASKYVEEHFKKLSASACKMGVSPDKADDLVIDVWISLVKAERNGEGYDMAYEGADGYISVEQFVYGRIKGYAMNKKYHSDGVEESGKRTSVISNQKQLVSCGLDEQGNLKFKETNSKKKVKISTIVCSASFEDTNSDYAGENDSFQRAYRVASSEDDLDSTLDHLSIREELEYTIRISELGGLNILNIFRNIDEIGRCLKETNSRKPSCLFQSIINVVESNPDFADALRNVLMYSSKHPGEFETLISCYA